MPRAPWICVLFLLAPASAVADPEQAMAAAVKLLDEVQEEQAIAVIGEALKKGDATAGQIAELNLLLAVAKFNLRDAAGAREAFRAALDANPAISIPKILPPKGWLVFEEVRVARETERAKAAQIAAPTPAVAPALVAPAPVGLSPRRIAGIGVGGAGVVGAVIGGALIGGAWGLRDQAVAEPGALAAQNLYLRANSQNRVGVGFIIGGAVVAVVGVVLLALPDGAPAATLAMGPSGISVAGRF